MMTIEKIWDGNEGTREDAHGNLHTFVEGWKWALLDNGVLVEVHDTLREAQLARTCAQFAKRAGVPACWQ